MGADLARARAGKKTRTGMSEAKLEEWAKMKHEKGEMPAIMRKKMKDADEEPKSKKKIKPGRGKKK